MMYREVKYLTETDEFKKFTDKFNFETIISNKKILLVSSKIVLNIYSISIEDHFYFEVYTRDLQSYSSIGRLVSKINSSELREIYENEKTKRTHILIENLETSYETTLKAEQHFFTYIKGMDKYLQFFLYGELQPYSKFFDEVTNDQVNELRVVLNYLLPL